MTCCTVNNCTSCLHCGSACDCKGQLYLQMSWDIGHKTFNLSSFVLSSSPWLSFSMTKEITVNINCNSWSITFPKNSDNEIFTQPHLPKLKMKLVVHPDYRCYWLFDFCLVNSHSNFYRTHVHMGSDNWVPISVFLYIHTTPFWP